MSDDIEQIVTAAKERPLDRLYREMLAISRAAAAETTLAPTGELLVRHSGHVTGVR